MLALLGTKVPMLRRDEEVGARLCVSQAARVLLHTPMSDQAGPDPASDFFLTVVSSHRCCQTPSLLAAKARNKLVHVYLFLS